MLKVLIGNEKSLPAQKYDHMMQKFLMSNHYADQRSENHYIHADSSHTIFVKIFRDQRGRIGRAKSILALMQLIQK